MKKIGFEYHTVHSSYPFLKLHYILFFLYLHYVDCGNEVLKGPFSENNATDPISTFILLTATPKWCTTYDTPYNIDGLSTKTHFAKMWFDLVIDSPDFLNLVQGQSDPYTYTTGKGCGYTLRGDRFSYSGKREDDILKSSSGDLYYIDEGESVGALDRNLLIGNTIPPMGEYSVSNPLRKVGSLQNIYLTLTPPDIVQRVKVGHFLAMSIENYNQSIFLT